MKILHLIIRIFLIKNEGFSVRINIKFYQYKIDNDFMHYLSTVKHLII